MWLSVCLLAIASAAPAVAPSPSPGPSPTDPVVRPPPPDGSRASIQIVLAGATDPWAAEALAQRLPSATARRLALSLDPDAPRALSATVAPLGWHYGAGWLQLELAVDWSLEDDRGASYEAMTRGIATHPVSGRIRARRRTRRGQSRRLPEAPQLLEEALQQAVDSLAERPALDTLLSHGTLALAEGTTRLIDDADPTRLGELPPLVQAQLARQTDLARNLGAGLATTGLIVASSAVGLRFVNSPNEPDGGLALMGAAGWTLVGSGGLLWFAGERRRDQW